MFLAISGLLITIYYIICKAVIKDSFLCRKYFTIISTIHLILVHALRDPYIFPDNQTYSYAFENISTLSFHETFFEINQWTTWERGYVALNWLLSRLSSNPELLFITTSLFIVVGIVRFFYKSSYSIIISIILWLLYNVLFYQSLFVLRQHIACVLVLFAVYNIRKTGIALLLIIFAILMHYSAIVILPFLLWSKFDITKIQSVRYIIASIVIIILFRFLIDIIINIFPRYGAYDNSERNSLPLFILGSLLFMHMLNRSITLAKDPIDLNILSFLAYGVIISVCIIGLPGGGRLSNYFTYIMPVAYPLLFKYNKNNRQIKILYSIFFIAVITYLFIQQLTPLNPNAFVEYKFFWE